MQRLVSTRACSPRIAACAGRGARAPARVAAGRRSPDPCSPAAPPAQIPAAAAAAIVAAALLASGAPLPASAVGMESITLPDAPNLGAAWAGIADGQKQKIAEADDAFAKSDTLKRLLEQSEANKSKNKKQIQDKYCYRQAELGIGDCGGLRFIPGMTQNGKQDTPKWLADLLGVEVPEPQGRTLKDLFDGQDLN